MLKVVSPWKGVVRFGKRGKLNPRYVGPFKVLKKVGAVAYKCELAQELSRVHNTFHISNLKKCYSDDPLVVPLEGLQVDDKLHFVEEPVEIMDREVKQLRRSRVPIVKVRWNSRRGPEFTWEREDQFRKKYPHLFTKTAPSSISSMSDSEDSTITYTEISTHMREPILIGFYQERKEPIFRIIVPPGYVPGPEEPPLPVAASPTTESLGYIPESDPEEDPEEDDEENPEEDPADYPADRGDDRDDEEPSDNDNDNDDDAKEEEHLAPVDPAAVAFSVDQDPYLAYIASTDRMIARRSSELGYGITDTLDGLEDDIIYSQLDDARNFTELIIRARVNIVLMDACDHECSERAISSSDYGHGSDSPKIDELHAADRRRQTMISNLLKADHRRQRQLVEALKIVKSLKTQMIELQRQQGPANKDPASQRYKRWPSSKFLDWVMNVATMQLFKYYGLFTA
ncbi:hypothetical protein Tco_0412015 [Tanacetum coccineum]